MDPHQIER
jgi:hypothetical protein